MELLLTTKITPGVNYYALVLHAVQELRSFLDVRRSFCWLILAPTKLK